MSIIIDEKRIFTEYDEFANVMFWDSSITPGVSRLLNLFLHLSILDSTKDKSGNGPTKGSIEIRLIIDILNLSRNNSNWIKNKIIDLKNVAFTMVDEEYYWLSKPVALISQTLLFKKIETIDNVVHYEFQEHFIDEYKEKILDQIEGGTEYLIDYKKSLSPLLVRYLKSKLYKDEDAVIEVPLKLLNSLACGEYSLDNNKGDLKYFKRDKLIPALEEIEELKIDIKVSKDVKREWSPELSDYIYTFKVSWSKEKNMGINAIKLIKNMNGFIEYANNKPIKTELRPGERVPFIIKKNDAKMYLEKYIKESSLKYNDKDLVGVIKAMENAIKNFDLPTGTFKESKTQKDKDKK